jgi:hypothetical protein
MNYQAHLHKYWKPSISFVVSVHPSGHKYQHGPHCTDCHKTLCWEFIQKPDKEPQIWLKKGKRFGHFIWRPKYVYSVDSNMNYFAARQYYKANPILHFHGQHSMVIYYWQLHGGQKQYKGNECTVVFPQQKWFCERATMLHYMYNYPSCF